MLPKKCPSCKLDLKIDHKVEEKEALFIVTCPYTSAPGDTIYIRKEPRIH